MGARAIALLLVLVTACTGKRVDSAALRRYEQRVLAINDNVRDGIL